MTLPYAVYILKCNDNTFYTGFTTNLEQRFRAHQKGEVKYTATRLPIEIAHVSYFADKQKAYDFERYLKSGSGMAFRNKRLL